MNKDIIKSVVQIKPCEGAKIHDEVGNKESNKSEDTAAGAYHRHAPAL